MTFHELLQFSDDPGLFELVRSLLSYEATTGEFRWAKDWNFKKAGTLAGGVASRKFRPEKYQRIKVDGKQYVAGILVWFWVTGKMPTKIYFKDGNGLNVSWFNLTTNPPVKAKRQQEANGVRAGG